MSELAGDVISEAKRRGESPDWWAVFAAGCTRDQGGLPYHISSEDEIRNTIETALKPLCQALPPPVLITVARSTDDGYCPPDQVSKMILKMIFLIQSDVAYNDYNLACVCVFVKSMSMTIDCNTVSGGFDSVTCVGYSEGSI